MTTVPGDAGAQCEIHCQSIGMSLSAVAIMANNVGCVCQPRRTVGGEAGITAGMATLVMQQQQAQSTLRAQQARQAQYRRTTQGR